MKQFIYLLKREFRLFFTNTTLLAVFFMAPIAYALLIGFTYKAGKVTNIPVIVINEDHTPMSYQLVDSRKNHLLPIELESRKFVFRNKMNVI